MSNVVLNFQYKGKELKIQSTRNEYMKDIFKKYSIKSQIDIKDKLFLYNGNLINENLKLEEINNKDNEINITVWDNKDENNNKEIINKSKDIICPVCGRIV